MSYIAKIALKHRGRFIQKGAKVPDDYERLADGISRGWIDVTGDPAAILPPVKTATAPPVIVEAEIITSEIVGETEIIAPEIAPVDGSPLIEDLDGLNPMARESLADIGIVNVAQLEGMDVESLDELRGIGVKLAQRLLAELEKHCEATRNAETEYSNMPEDEHGSYETSEASDEDEGTEND